ncbi:MAG: septal ring lytic transglycosylase RlpA family protein [Candidatus Competibacteraceae bacterium]|nr:septal ring lytic transglycosylase RlpA family protein [Candidatus Competibacteraceae bacterium]MCB1810416.1 septal ring lytic transglycosylase RlpA family protein [Candidatus Competibacteraceae bacterium]
MNQLQVDVVLATLLALTLSACSSVSDQPGSVGAAAQTGNAIGRIPHELPPSRYGNPETYEVFGREYSVQTTSYGYQKRGMASWYGPKFHGKRTSSGTPYDMHQMTAAHKTLPIPTFVQVTRLDTGRSIIVEVNDRGPFVDDRLIDLSYAAAKQLDMVGPGTAPVEVKALPPYQYLARHQGPRLQPSQPGESMIAAAQNSAPARPVTTPVVSSVTAASMSQSTAAKTQTVAAAYPTRRNVSSLKTEIPATGGATAAEPAASSTSFVAAATAPAASANSPVAEPLQLLPAAPVAGGTYAAVQTPESTATTPADPAAHNTYLQAGAFAQKASAERLRTWLSQSLAWGVRVDSTVDTVHRVRVGPLHDPQDIAEVQLTLAQLGIQNAYLVTQADLEN